MFYTVVQVLPNKVYYLDTHPEPKKKKKKKT